MTKEAHNYYMKIIFWEHVLSQKKMLELCIELSQNISFSLL